MFKPSVVKTAISFLAVLAPAHLGKEQHGEGQVGAKWSRLQMRAEESLVSRPV